MMSGRRPPSYQNHNGLWLVAALGMLGLSAIRFLALEDVLRGELRLAMASMDIHETRSAFQIPAVAIVCALGLALIWFALRRLRTKRASKLEISVVVGKLALIGLIVLLSLRIVSFHAVDTILFTRFLGPIRLNWILDIGLATALASAALGFASISRNMR